MTLVVDASVVFAALIDIGPNGQWSERMLTSHALAAPHHMLVEVASVLRTAALGGVISSDVATLAYADLLELRVDLFSYRVVADRVWELRQAVSVYDAWYVALAESLSVPLATLDARLRRAAGPQCDFVTPSA